MKHHSNFSPETVYFSQMYDVKDIAELFDKNNKQNSWKSKSFYILALFKSCKMTRQNTSKMSCEKLIWSLCGWHDHSSQRGHFVFCHELWLRSVSDPDWGQTGDSDETLIPRLRLTEGRRGMLATFYSSLEVFKWPLSLWFTSHQTGTGSPWLWISEIGYFILFNANVQM